MDGQNSTSSSSEGVAVGCFEGPFCEVHVRTKQDSLYVLPDMSLSELKKALPQSGRVPSSMPTLAMVNASAAVLSIPFRIIATIYTDEEVLWACPA
jgi:hypothetical protein